MVKRKQKPRTTTAHKQAAIDTAVKALPSPRPDSPMYKSWRAVADALGIDERAQPQTLAELLENPDPHGRLAASLKTSLDAHARAAGRDTTETAIRNTLLAAKLELVGVDLSLARPFNKARKNKLQSAMQLTGIKPLPPVDTFLKWLRRRAAE